MNRAIDDAPAGVPGPKAEGFAFRKRHGRAWGNIRIAFEDACRAAEVDKFRFHDLCHTCASWLVMKGRSLKEMQEILDRLRDAIASLGGFSTKSAQGAKIEADRRVNPDAPVAQVDRAAVS
jgi:hypothetical protein